MGIEPGTYDIGPEAGRLLIKTTRAGLGAKAGHDLTLEPARWRGRAVVADPAGSSVTVEVDVASIEVKEGSGGIKPLSDSDRADIVRNLREKVLNAREHPTITFRSSRVDGTLESFHVEGDLTIAGATHTVTIDGRAAGDRVRGSTTVVQSRWGIRPYSALFGALKLSDEVGVEFDIALTTRA
ncbi:YceI family protein [Microtetraspora niveoalba]|uniref:YceI family protein n=1 Tax=Microtetraspora niveoalba TaxID=46175 RepID=UPI00082E37B5|nr:YceI family protein [Microtetraspora niveoalba]